MAKKVVRTGISLDSSIAKKLEEVIKKSPELKLDRSEVVNSILGAYFTEIKPSLLQTKETIMKKRKKEL
ncbi:MAG: hypothetical protein HYS32_03200 [Candidatus Woesearchaeota archaeon]|nr:MAG: hypothetical protein HYS32_03200 [Candidatus Woesearchaeota archaeon]